MKILVPVAAMVVAAGSCCCCGGDIESLIEDIQREAGGGSSITVDGDDAEIAVDGEGGEVVVKTGGGGSGNTEGMCGRFKDEGLTVPSGLKVITCATTGSNETVLMQGSADPKEACVPMKEWATSNGWNVTTEASIPGTQSIIAKNADKQLTIACTDQTGQTTVSVNISQSY